MCAKSDDETAHCMDGTERLGCWVVRSTLTGQYQFYDYYPVEMEKTAPRQIEIRTLTWCVHTGTEQNGGS